MDTFLSIECILKVFPVGEQSRWHCSVCTGASMADYLPVFLYCSVMARVNFRSVLKPFRVHLSLREQVKKRKRFIECGHIKPFRRAIAEKLGIV